MVTVDKGNGYYGILINKMKHLLVNKIEVTKTGFETNEDFDNSTLEEKEDIIQDQALNILIIWNRRYIHYAVS